MKWTTALLLLVPCLLVAADDYELRMTRPSKVGDRSKSSGVYAEERKTNLKVEGKDVKAEDVTVDLEYAFEREVRAVSPEGRVTEHRLKLSKLTGKLNGNAISSPSAGDEIVVTRNGKERKITVNGSAATKEQELLIKGWGNVSGGGSTTDDDAFGTRKRIRAGDSWPVNAEAVTKQGVEHGFDGVKAEGVKGTAKFQDVVTENGKPCLRIHGNVKLEGSDIPMPSGPPGMKVNSISMEVEMESAFPVDVAERIVPSEKSAMRMNFTASGEVDARGRKVKVETTVQGKTLRSAKTQPIE